MNRQPKPNITEILEPTTDEMIATMNRMVRKGVEKAKAEVMQKGLDAMRESFPPPPPVASPVTQEIKAVPEATQVPKEGVKTSKSDAVTQVRKEEVKTSAPKAAEAPKTEAKTLSTMFAHWSAQQKRLATWLAGVTALVVVGVVVLALVRETGKPEEPVHVEPVAVTSIVPSATSPPGISRANESITTTATVPAMSATVQAHPSAMVQPPRRPKTAPAITVEKKTEPEPVTPPAPTATVKSTPPAKTPTSGTEFSVMTEEENK